MVLDSVWLVFGGFWWFLVVFSAVSEWFLVVVGGF